MIIKPTYSITQGIPIFCWGKDYINFFGEVMIKGNNINEKFNGTILYENKEGLFTGTDTINDDISKYKKILVEVTGLSIYSTFVFLEPSNKTLNCIIDTEPSEKYYVPSSIIFKIVEETITILKNVTLAINTTEQSLSENNEYYKTKITKIIGYK